MGFFDNILGKGKGEEKAEEEELTAEEKERRERAIASLKEELAQVNRDIFEFQKKIAEATRTIAEATAKLADPLEAPSAALEIAQARKDIDEYKDSIKNLKDKKKELESGLKSLGVNVGGRGFGTPAISGNVSKLITPIIFLVAGIIISAFFFFAIIPVIIIFFIWIAAALFPGFGAKVHGVIAKTIPWILLIIVIVGAIWAIYFFFFTTTGTYIVAEAGGGKASLLNSFRTFAAPLNQFKMIMTGEYDPSQLWTSKTYKDEYTGIDAGVEISNLRPLREYFASDQELTILGNLKVTSLPEEGTSVSISANWDGPEPEKWTCKPDKIEKENLFVGRFSCTHPPVDISKPSESYTATVSVDYDFAMKAGKQIYVGDYDTMSSLFTNGQDPMEYFDISKDQLKSWQTKSPVEIGMGILGEEGILTANKGDYDLWYYLGVTITNKGSGKISKISGDDFTLTLPDLPNAIKAGSGEDMDFNYSSDKTVGGVKLKVYRLKGNKAGELNLEPGMSKTYYFKFRVWNDDFLKGAQISSFFALANLKFNYEDSQSVAIKIKKMTSEST